MYLLGLLADAYTNNTLDAGGGVHKSQVLLIF